MYNPFRKDLAGIFKSFNKVIAELDNLIDQNAKEIDKLQAVINDAVDGIAYNTNENVVALAARNNLRKLLGAE